MRLPAIFFTVTVPLLALHIENEARNMLPSLRALERKSGFATPDSNCVAKSPFPAKHKCGVSGHVKASLKSQAGDNQTRDTFELCQDSCLERSGSDYRACVSFGYDSITSLCSLFNQELGQPLGFRNNTSSSTDFYSSRCFKCPPPDCPSMSNGNLIDNGGFELSEAYDGPWFRFTGDNAGNSSIVTPGNGSPRALRCDNGYCGLGQYRDFCAQGLYTLSFDVKLIRQGAPARLLYDAVFEIGDWQLIDNLDNIVNSMSDTWVTIKTTFRAFVFDALQFKPDLGAPFTSIFLDNVVVLPAPSSYATKRPSLVGNGDFSSGITSPWNVTIEGSHGRVGNYAVTTDGLAEGNYAFVYKTATGKHRRAGYVALTQSFPVRTFTPYVLTFDYRILGIKASVGAFVGNLSYDEGMTFLPGTMSKVAGESQAGTFSRIFTPTNGNISGVQIFVTTPDIHLAGKPTFSVALDNITVVELA